MPKTPKRNPRELVNKTTAAKIVGCSRPTVEAMLARQELESETVAGMQLIVRASAEKARRRREALAQQRSTDSPAAAA